MSNLVYTVQRTAEDGAVTYFSNDDGYVAKLLHASTFTLDDVCEVYNSVFNLNDGNKYAIVRGRSENERYAIKRTSAENGVSYYTGECYADDVELSLLFNEHSANELCDMLNDRNDGDSYEVVDVVAAVTEQATHGESANRYVIMRTHRQGYVDYFAGSRHYRNYHYTATRFAHDEAQSVCDMLNKYDDENIFDVVDVED